MEKWLERYAPYHSCSLLRFPADGRRAVGTGPQNRYIRFLKGSNARCRHFGNVIPAGCWTMLDICKNKSQKDPNLRPVQCFVTPIYTRRTPPRMYINILLDTVLATDVNKYSLPYARCQQRWTSMGNWIYF